MEINLPVLNSGDVVVRKLRKQDARILNEELALGANWLIPWEATNPYGQTSRIISPKLMLKTARKGTLIPSVITYQGQIVGQLNVSQISWGSLSSCSIGYWIAERFAGKGIMTTAVALMIDYLLLDLGLHRAEICIRPENKKSLRIVEKLGLRFEGVKERYIHINGEWTDHNCFAVTKEEIPNGLLSKARAPRQS